MDDRLVVCSVFAGYEHDAFWLQTQRAFLDRSGKPYVHAVYLAHRANRSRFSDSVIVGQGAKDELAGVEHLAGLNALADYCGANPHRAYLFLDSDAWPCDVEWETKLTALMTRLDRPIAAPIRVENIESHWHPCIVYTRDVSLLDFAWIRGMTLLGDTMEDPGVRSPKILSLIRTNRLNVHPTVAAIYGDVFYHHGAGSRLPSMRSIKAGYYDHVLPHAVPPEEVFARLQANPQKFVDELRWASQ